MIEVGNAQSLGKRKNQEDYFATHQIKDGMLCIVADGMGGYEGGEVASVTSVKSFINFFKDNFERLTLEKNLIQALEFANENIKIAKEKNNSLENMGTTFVALFITESEISWISVGDSILYRYRNNQLVRLNENHSVSGELQKDIVAGKITREEADATPNKHALTSVLSGHPIPHIDLQHLSYDIQYDDIYILTSDGIHTLSDKKIESLIYKTNTVDIAEKLINEIEKIDTPNQDNTSIIIVKTIDEKNITKKKKLILLFISILLLTMFIVSILTYLYQVKQNDNTELNTSQITFSEDNKTKLNDLEINQTSVITTPNTTLEVDEINQTIELNSTTKEIVIISEESDLNKTLTDDEVK